MRTRDPMTDAEAREAFWAAVRDPDPSSMEIAQDIALERSWKLWKLGEDRNDVRGVYWGHLTKQAPYLAYGGFWFDVGAGIEQNGCEWRIQLAKKKRAEMYEIELFFSFTSDDGELHPSMDQWNWVSSGYYPTINDARRAAARYAWWATKVMKSGYEDGTHADRVRGVIEDRQMDFMPPELNPMRKNPDDLSAARDKYEEFHRYAPKSEGEFPSSFAIPKRLLCAGKAKWVTYRSGKVDPSTLQKPRRPVDYIHEHDAGVMTYIKDASPDTDVPEKFRDVGALVKLGDCLGFCVVDADGEEVEAEGTSPLPELYSTPDGKCLFVIQSKRDVLAASWGGALGVFARGIDG